MFLLINKPENITSHDVIDKLRKITNIKKIGHAGTLDPFATGLLIVAIDRESTKQLDLFLKMDKTYEATLKLGATSDTYDKTGQISTNPNSPLPTPEKIEKTLNQFKGKQNQTPPMYSAKKVKGKKLYELARKGIEIERKPHQIEIYNIELLKITNLKLKIEVQCTSGTYIRSLAADIGQTLGCGAYLESLTRTAIGPYQLDQAVNLDHLTKNNWQKYCFEIKKSAD